jgi:hypothetical protein
MRRRLSRPCRSPVWTSSPSGLITRADRRAGGLSASAIPKLWAELGYATTVHIAQGVTADTRHGVVMARSQGSSCLRGHPAPLARAGADPVAELLTPKLPCRPSSMNRCGASRDLQAHIMESAQTFPGVHTPLVIFL